MKVQIIQDPIGFANLILKGVDEKIEDLKKSYSPKEPNKYLSRNETAEYIGVSLTCLWHWNKKGILKPKGIGNKVLYLLSDIENAIIDLK